MYIGVGLILLVISILIINDGKIETDLKKVETVLGEQQNQPSESASPEPIINSSPTTISTLAPSPPSTPTKNSNNSSVTIKQNINDQSNTKIDTVLIDFKYPSSNQISGSQNRLELESSGDSSVITNWYKEKIKSLGYKSKSFVQTSSNGYILNKLVGASGSSEIRVQIEKSSSSGIVKIVVDLTT
jgi:Tfp pilus assembly protein PilX